jgi:hypothetical protein
MSASGNGERRSSVKITERRYEETTEALLNIPDAKPTDFVKVTLHVYHSKAQPSGIVVQVLPNPAEESNWRIPE